MRSDSKFWLTAGLCAAVVQMFAAVAPAATDFTTPTTVDGWLITPASGISLTANTSSSTDLALTKTATFSTTAEGLIISFTQVSANAAPTITFTSESLTNSSGSTWGGFQFQLLDDNGNAAFTSGTGTPFQPGTGYTSGMFSPTVIVYGGSQAESAVSTWGTTSSLVLNADPLGIGTNFVLKEVPLTGSEVVLPGGVAIPIIGPSTPPGTVVPLPAAVWPGGIGLLAIALFRLGRKFKTV